MKKTLLFLSCILTLIGSTSVLAQGQSGVYGFTAIPQSLLSNPATVQQSRFFFSLPGFSDAQLSLRNTGFSLDEIFKKGSDINQDVDKVLRNLTNEDYLMLNAQVSNLYFGFNTKIGNFSFGTYNHMNMFYNIPSELLKVVRAVDDTYIGQSMSLDHQHSSFTNYQTFHAGYQNQFLDDRLSLGLRFKYYKGLVNFQTEKFIFNIDRISNQQLNITTDVVLNTSGAYEIEHGDPMNLLSGNNTGTSLDFGASFKLNDKLSFSASVLDMGAKIKWSNDVKVHSANGTFEFDGLDIDLNDEDSFNEAIEELKEDVADALNFDEQRVNTSYTSILPSHTYVSAQYNFHKKHSLIGVYRLTSAEHYDYSSVSLKYFTQLTRPLQFIASVNMNSIETQFGLGASLKLGPLQLFVITENVVGAFYPGRSKTLDTSFGINFLAYKKKDKKQNPEEDKEEELEVKKKEKKDEKKDKEKDTKASDKKKKEKKKKKEPKEKKEKKEKKTKKE